MKTVIEIVNYMGENDIFIQFFPVNCTYSKHLERNMEENRELDSTILKTSFHKPSVWEELQKQDKA